MLTGVEILLERMKTNPEEFIEGGYSKWSRVLDAGFAVMTEEERTALQDALIEAKREHFNGEVMRVLSQGHDEQEKEPVRYTTAGWNDPRSLLTPEVMRQQVKDALDKQFDEAYARKDKQTMKSVSKLKEAMKK